MMSTSLRLQGEMRGLVLGLRQLTMNSATTPGNLAVNLACPSNRQFSAAAPPLEIPKKPNTPWVNFFKANLPEYREKNPGAKVSELMSKMSAEWKKLPTHTKVNKAEQNLGIMVQLTEAVSTSDTGSNGCSV